MILDFGIRLFYPLTAPVFLGATLNVILCLLYSPAGRILRCFSIKSLNSLLFPPSFMNHVVSRYIGLIPKIGRLFRSS